MKKKILAFISIFLTCFCLTGCIKGNRLENQENTSWYGILNDGSCFVYTFKDEETGVWYISTSEGVTPRLNPDGTVYVSE